MTRTRIVYHLHIKKTGEDYFYGSIKAITDRHSHTALGVGIDSLYRVDWNKGYSNEKISIKKGPLHTTVSVRAAAKAGKKKK